MYVFHSTATTNLCVQRLQGHHINWPLAGVAASTPNIAVRPVDYLKTIMPEEELIDAILPRASAEAPMATGAAAPEATPATAAAEAGKRRCTRARPGKGNAPTAE